MAAAVLLVSGCHSTSNNSGYGIAWITLGSVPAPVFTSYVVNVDSVTLTDTVGNVYTALATVEPVDFTKLRDVRELWGSATIPNDTYKSATIVLDYTTAAISVLVNGVPQKATVVGPTGAAVTTVSMTVNFDPAHQPVVTPSYSSDNALIMAINFDLLASNKVNFSTSPATVTVNPFMTIGLAPPDNELLRIRGPMINSSVTVGTFSVYERPFYDQVNAIGSVSIFNDQNTIFTIDGVSYAGTAGLNVLSQDPAGVTITETYTTFEPTATGTAYAGKFNSVYVVAGNSLQSTLTENISGEVIAIAHDAAANTNTLTLRGATVYGPLVSLAEGYFGYQDTDALLTVGPSTMVTADDNATLKGLNYNSIAVGQYVEAVGGAFGCTGTCGTSGTGVWTIDATSAATGKVRLLSTQVYGQLIAAAPGSLSIALQTINDWPASVFNFAGSGTSPANDASAADYIVNTGTLDLSGTAAGTNLWIDGLANAFGAAPPDFNATAVNQEAAVRATLQAVWTTAGSTTPFTAFSSAGFSINLQDPNLTSAALQIGPEIVPLSSLPATPQFVPTSTPISITAAPVFLPHFAYSAVTTVSGVSTTSISVFGSFANFVTNLVPAITSATPVRQATADGYYDRATNSFTANTISIVL